MAEDLDIVKKLNEYKEKTTGDIYTGLYVKEELIQFEYVKLFEDRVEVMLPTSF